VIAQTATVVTELMKDVDGVQQKLVALAQAMPVDKYAWRPGTGVRSVGEVFLHVASDNYLLPALAGTAMPASTNLDMKNFKTFETYEKRGLTREQIVADLESSFVHLKAAMTLTTPAMISNPVDMFGQKATQQALWIMTATHSRALGRHCVRAHERRDAAVEQVAAQAGVSSGATSSGA
jgi:hypothetical protein